VSAGTADPAGITPARPEETTTPERRKPQEDHSDLPAPARLPG
jgi:hypothetical protein